MATAIQPSKVTMAWTRSSPIVERSDDLRSLVTTSGTRWQLGFQLSMHALPRLDLEAQVAFALLFETDGPETDLLWELPSNLDRRDCVRWLTACKVSRHLVLERPEPDRRAVDLFLENYEGAYLRQRRLR